MDINNDSAPAGNANGAAPAPGVTNDEETTNAAAKPSTKEAKASARRTRKDAESAHSGRTSAVTAGKKHSSKLQRNPDLTFTHGLERYGPDEPEGHNVEDLDKLFPPTEATPGLLLDEESEDDEGEDNEGK